MSDKNKQMGDEYQFPQDEYVAAEDETQQPNDDAFKDEHSTEEQASVETPAQKKSLLERLPILQNKRVLIVVGSIVVALIGFQLTKPSHKTTVIKQAQQPTQQQSLVSMQQDQQNALMNKMNRISQTASNTQSVENQLQNEISALKVLLNQSNESNKAMKSAMIALAQQVESLSAQVKKATTAPSHIKKLPPAPVLTFHLRAIIPGRAWLVGSDGETNSVVVGDTVKNYGKVTAIEVDAGKVLTSSGKVITYNSDGN